MCTVWHVDKYKITFKLVIDYWSQGPVPGRGPAVEKHCCRGLHSEELRHLYASQNVTVIKSRRMWWAGHIAQIGELRNTYCISVGKREEMRPLRRICWEVMDWIHVAQDRDQWWALVNTVMIEFRKRRVISWLGDYYFLKRDSAPLVS
jgi:hypothetical protein